MAYTRVAALLLKWYSRSARDLPWRRRVTPYRTLVSEVMLQQTRVETVIPYFRRWMLRFPSLRALAAASERSVLRLWEGLGYYSRARNLHRAARILVRERHARLPSDPAVLRTLPGVGEYIAAAVASIAFGRDLAALDANVRRVLARVACMRLPIKSAAAGHQLHLVASRHLPKGRAGDFNQALMDLGALVCLPRQPRCEVCPLSVVCEAHRRGLQSGIPVRTKLPRRPHYYSVAAVIVRGERVVLVQRPPRGLLADLWEFPKSQQRPSLPSHPQMLRDLEAGPAGGPALVVASWNALTAVDHSYSHFSITVHAFLCTPTGASRYPRMQWVPIDRLSALPYGQGRSNDCPAARKQRASGGWPSARAHFGPIMSDRYAAGRTRMIDQQMRDRGLQDPRLLAAISAVPRHLFVPVSSRSASYDDSPLPIGGGQTISQPYIVALMTAALAVLPDDRVLEVGTGSGYQAAILSHLAGEVHTVEILPALSARASRLAARLHLNNIIFHIGDGSLGWPESAPYNAIIVTAAAPAPPPLAAGAARGRRSTGGTPGCCAGVSGPQAIEVGKRPHI